MEDQGCWWEEEEEEEEDNELHPDCTWEAVAQEGQIVWAGLSAPLSPAILKNLSQVHLRQGDNITHKIVLRIKW